MCQQNNERVFKPVWYLYVANQQWRDCAFSVNNIGDIPVRVWLALDAVLGAFQFYPFAVSPEKIRREYGPHIFAILNRNYEAVTHHQKLARRIGKAWVDDRVRGNFNDSQVQELDAVKPPCLSSYGAG